MSEFDWTGTKDETHMACFPTLAIVQQHPVINTVVLFTSGLEHFGEEFSKKIIVRVLFKAEFADIIHVYRKFLWYLD
jgi:hypothetical protein